MRAVLQKELLAEDAPSGVVAGDRAQQNNPTPTNHEVPVVNFVFIIIIIIIPMPCLHGCMA